MSCLSILSCFVNLYRVLCHIRLSCFYVVLYFICKHRTKINWRFSLRVCKVSFEILCPKIVGE